MKKVTIIGVSVFILGIILTIISSILPIFWTSEDILFWGLRAGFVVMGIGAAVLIVFLILERVRDNKKFKKEIKEKDLRP
ncbi:MAG: hypothetical protein V3R31_04805 [Candidatus Humimicrobiaceae bacterium]